MSIFRKWYMRAGASVLIGFIAGCAVSFCYLLLAYGYRRTSFLLSQAATVALLAGVPASIASVLFFSWISKKYGHPSDNETRCRQCGYILCGITEPRCPECGERI